MIVRFEFKGGCRNGTVIIGEDDPALGSTKNPLHAYLHLTQRGRVGTRFREPLSSAMRETRRKEFDKLVGEAIRAGKEVPKGKYPADYQIYEIAEWRIGPEGISIRADYVGDEGVVPWSEGPKEKHGFKFLETLDDFRHMLADPTGWHKRHLCVTFTRDGMSKTPRAFAKAQRFLRIIDAMTDAERKYPSTLIDRMAEERIAQDAGVASEDVKRIVQVFTSLTVIGE